MEAGSYSDYARAVLDTYGKRNADERNILFDALAGATIGRVLDLGCGPGQELIPFLVNSDAVCVGVDIADALGQVAIPFFREEGFATRANFVQATGERLPFADASFDVVLCRVALPYMNNRGTIAEVGRILSPGGTFLLKTHAPAFYIGMIGERLKTLNPKQLAYPVICLAAGLWHLATGRQLTSGIWKGKEIFQTRQFLEREFATHGLRIDGE